MITIDLKKDKHTIDELLALASSESLLISDKSGNKFVLEETDDFEDEIEKLKSSKKLMKFLDKRSNEDNFVSIADIAQKLGMKDVQ